MSFDTSSGNARLTRERLLFLAILTPVLTLTALDIYADYNEGGSLEHIALEGLLLALTGAGLIIILKKLLKSNEEIKSISRNLAQTEKDMDKWRKDAQKYLNGLSIAIDQQFERWQFTPAEKEIGFLLLKGLSFKEVASIRKTSERTVRQQSLVIYKKSGLAGRAELSAFFLEDLLPSVADRENGV